LVYPKNFNKIKDQILEKNKDKPYPEIDSFPE